MKDASARFTAGIRINMNQGRHDEDVLPQLNEVLRGYPGKMEVTVSLQMETGDMVQLVSRKHRVSITPN